MHRSAEHSRRSTHLPHDPDISIQPQAPLASWIDVGGVRVPDSVLRFSYTASPGPGGQNVNKRATKAELRVDVAALPLDPAAAARLRTLAGKRLNLAGEIVLVSDDLRSQARNKAACIERLGELLVAARRPPKVRRATKPTASSRRRRVETKRRASEIKSRRRRPNED